MDYPKEQLKGKGNPSGRLLIKKNKAAARNTSVAFMFMSILLIAVLIAGYRGGDDPGNPLMVIAIIGFIASVFFLVRTLTKEQFYTFDRKADTLDLDGKQLGRLSDITEVTVKYIGRGAYVVQVNYSNRDGTRLGLYYHKSSADDTANQIADFLFVPVSHKWGFF
ncbi:MAG: hypothetical protein DLM69_00545 [Candidatus Chloroheliales bacterium]|nr:MAG: hypothetical protein DLM69_00545 [Chloroflexota bacterium]